MHEKLERSAQRAARTRDRVQRWRLSESPSSLMLYLYWRNRYPIITRVLGRIFLFVELYLIYQLFSTSIAASLSFIIFIVFVVKGIFQGISQYFRVKIIEAEQQKNSGSLVRLNSSLQLLTVIYGTLTGLIITGAAVYLTEQALVISFAVAWLFILPIQLSTSAYWMSVYTSHRLQRSFLVIIGCRALPSIGILFGAQLLGVFAYPISLLLGRYIEQWYLGVLAKESLTHSGAVRGVELKQKLRGVRSALSDPTFWKRILVSSSFYIFQLGVAVFLYLRGVEMWFTHFGFFFVLATSSYIPLRIPQSLGMDLYLALKYGNLARSEHYSRIIRKLTWICMLFMAALFVTLLVSCTSLLTAGGDIIYSLFLYFILLLFVRSWFLTEFAIARFAALETKSLWLLVFALIVFALPVQFFAIHYLRANLPLVYTIEIAFFFIVTLWLRKGIRLEDSEIYLRALTLSQRSSEVMQPWIWMRSFDQSFSKNNKPALFIVQLDIRYQSLSKETNFLHALREREEDSFYITEIIPCLLLVRVPHQSGVDVSQFQLRYAGHIRNVIPLQPLASIQEGIEEILSAVSRVREQTSLMRHYSLRLRRIVREPIDQHVLEIREIISSTPPQELAYRVLKFVERYVDHQLSGVLFDGSRLRERGHVSLRCLELAHRCCVAEGGVRRIGPYIRHSLPVINIFHHPLMVLDAHALPLHVKEKLYDVALLVGVIGSCEIIRQRQHST